MLSWSIDSELLWYLLYLTLCWMLQGYEMKNVVILSSVPPALGWAMILGFLCQGMRSSHSISVVLEW